MTGAESGLSELVVEEVSSQVDVADLVDDGSLTDTLDAEELGASIGGEVGERLGRELGESIGREVQATFAESVDRGDDVGELADAVAGAIRDALGEALGDVDDRESLVSSLRELATEGRPGADDSEAADVEVDEGDEATDADVDRDAETEAGAVEDDGTAEADDGAEATEAVSADDLDLGDLRRETLADFLEVMDYRDLQSVAKDVGVKANLSREEMTDEIVEAVTDGEQPAAGDEEPEPDEEGDGS